MEFGKLSLTDISFTMHICVWLLLMMTGVTPHQTVWLNLGEMQNLWSASISAFMHLQALFDLEATNQELKSDLRDLYITAAKEVDVNASRKAIIIHVRTASSQTLLM